jgi:hypothetical protein
MVSGVGGIEMKLPRDLSLHPNPQAALRWLMVGICLMLSGCHLVFPFRSEGPASNDAAADGKSVADFARSDGPFTDQTTDDSQNANPDTALTDSSATTSILVAEDVSVNQATPTSTTGSESSLPVRGEIGVRREVLLRFPVISAAIVSAALQLHIDDWQAGTATVYALPPGTGWREGVTVWNTRPNSAVVLGTLAPVAGQPSIKLDITAALTANQSIPFEVLIRADTASTDMKFFSKEESSGKKAPAIVISL